MPVIESFNFFPGRSAGTVCPLEFPYCCRRGKGVDGKTTRCAPRNPRVFLLQLSAGSFRPNATECVERFRTLCEFRCSSCKHRCAPRAVEKAAADAKSSADNAWMLISSALVLLMTGPGLALFYGGLVRKKNVLGTLMQSFAMMAVISVLWAIVGYSLCFGPGNGFIGGFHNIFLRGVGLQPDPDYAATIPAQTYMIYQLMFAIITPALITGAFAERMKFSAMLLFLTLWSLLVYDPMAHMVWGKGGIAECLARRNVSHARFCRRHGGTRHFRRFRAGLRALSGQAPGISEGRPCRRTAWCSVSSARVCCGWAGSASTPEARWPRAGLATSAFVATHFGAAAAAAVGWSAAEWLRNGKAQRPRSDFRRRRRACRHHPGGRICQPDVRR